MGNTALTNPKLRTRDEPLPSNRVRFTRDTPPSLHVLSRPVTTFSSLTFKRDRTSTVISFILHLCVLAAIVWFALEVHTHIVAPKQVAVVPIQIQPYIPITAPAPKTMGGGGGGGAKEVVPPVKGHLPPVVKTPSVPIQELQVDHPKLAAAPAVHLPQPVKFLNNKLPNLGDTQSPQIALSSQGSGSGGGFGQTSGGGIGSGQGSGVGIGSGGGYGGGVMSVGGGVSAPVLIHKVEPEFTDAARRNNYQGTVAVQLIVDPQGNPEDIRVIHHLGMGLDQKAVAAVQQYKFKPAMFHGSPVAVQMVIEVAFHLYS